MDTWIVGKTPIGVFQPPRDIPTAQEAPDVSILFSSKLYFWNYVQRYVFFFKAHIMAGQVHPAKANIKTFAWLTKQEIEPRVDKHYWEGIRDMLSDF